MALVEPPLPPIRLGHGRHAPRYCPWRRAARRAAVGWLQYSPCRDSCPSAYGAADAVLEAAAGLLDALLLIGAGLVVQTVPPVGGRRRVFVSENG